MEVPLVEETEAYEVDILDGADVKRVLTTSTNSAVYSAAQQTADSSPGQAVYEPFMGSGTTLIAAETTGRVCRGIELNPAYVAVQRWQQFSGQQAVVDGTGESFADLTANPR